MACSLSPRTSIWVAVTLLIIGVLRFATDLLHEADPLYWQSLADSPLRYFIRAPSDGTVWGNLNAQWFKLLSIPCGVSLVFFLHLFGPGTAQSRQREFEDWAVRGTWVLVFFLGFLVIELEKQFSIFQSQAVELSGEACALNHVVHTLSALLAWKLGGMLRMVPKHADDEAWADPTLERPRAVSWE